VIAIDQLIAELEERDLLTLAKQFAKAHSVTLEEMLGADRCRPAAAARHEFWTHLYDQGHWSYPRIGVLFGRDHSTIMQAVKQCRSGKPRVRRTAA
jgi:chromosomal replication initiation ATPase DnaA